MILNSSFKKKNQYFTKFVLSLVLLFFLYPIAFNILPAFSTRVVMGVFGAIYLLVFYIQRLRNDRIHVKKQYLYLGALLSIIVMCSLIAISYNGTNDLAFIKYFVSVLIVFFAAHAVLLVFQKSSFCISKKNIMIIVVYSVALQSAISIFLYLNPNVQEFFNNILSMSDLRRSVLDMQTGRRIVGFGRAFFEAGIYSGMALIFIGYLIRYYSFEFKEFLKISFIYLFIFSVGMMMSRTTMVGFLLSLLFIFIPRDFNFLILSRKSFYFLALIALLMFLMFFIYLIIGAGFISSNEKLFRFGFEPFLNVVEKASIETETTNFVFKMFFFPDNLKTWIIGDGLWVVNGGMNFYMSTDVGYSRLIFYFGISGLLAFFTYHIFLIWECNQKKLAVFLFVLYFFILNVKGFSDLTAFFALIFIAKPYYTK